MNEATLTVKAMEIHLIKGKERERERRAWDSRETRGRRSALSATTNQKNDLLLLRIIIEAHRSQNQEGQRDKEG